MRAIVINPYSRSVHEVEIPLDHEFLSTLKAIIGTKQLFIQSTPGQAAMFVDAVGIFADEPHFWRTVQEDTSDKNIAGIGVLFALGPDGRMVDQPPQITADTVAQMVVWSGDRLAAHEERMMLLDVETGELAQPGAPAVPVIARKPIWVAGPSVRAAEPPAPKKRRKAPAGAKKTREPDLYGDASSIGAPAAAAPSVAAKKPPAAAPVAPAAPAPAAAPLPHVFAIRETADNRVQTTEYVVGPGGEMVMEGVATYPNLDAARAALPKTAASRVAADEDTEDEDLIETWY